MDNNNFKTGQRLDSINQRISSMKRHLPEESKAMSIPKKQNFGSELPTQSVYNPLNPMDRMLFPDPVQSKILMIESNGILGLEFEQESDLATAQPSHAVENKPKKFR